MQKLLILSARHLSHCKSHVVARTALPSFLKIREQVTFRSVQHPKDPCLCRLAFYLSKCLDNFQIALVSFNLVVAAPPHRRPLAVMRSIVVECATPSLFCSLILLCRQYVERSARKRQGKTTTVSMIRRR